MEFSTRQATPTDLPKIKALALECSTDSAPAERNISQEIIQAATAKFWDSLPMLSKLNPFQLYVLEEKDSKEMAAYMLLLLNQVEFNTGEKQTIVVDGGIAPKFRGKWLFKLCLKKIEEIARENNNTGLLGFITVSNKRSLVMSKACGFEVERYQVVKDLRQPPPKSSGPAKS